jgi:anaerobic dimethyl sulfoxide reductase subunit B (iron-sulfur subunit)
MIRSAGFVLDLSRCVGCGACVLACRIENPVPAGISWRRVVPLNLARYAQGPTYFFSLACHHCEEPPCARGCPSGALEKRGDGVVILHSERCLGCRYCEMVCPFGAPAYDAQAGVMTKCHLCYHRLDAGRLPACVSACPTEALGYGPPQGQGEGRFVNAEQVPGFVNPGNVRPALGLGPPGGEIRSERFRSLQKDLEAPDE